MAAWAVEDEGASGMSVDSEAAEEGVGEVERWVEAGRGDCGVDCGMSARLRAVRAAAVGGQPAGRVLVRRDGRLCAVGVGGLKGGRVKAGHVEAAGLYGGHVA